MKYLVLFMESRQALPVDMLDRKLCCDRGVPSGSVIGELLAKAGPGSTESIDPGSIDGYTTIEVADHDEAVAVARNWSWTGGVKVLPLTANA